MNARVLGRLIAMNVSVSLTYRASTFFFMVSTTISPLIALFVWQTVSAQGVALPYDRAQFVTYYVLLAVVSLLTNTWLGYYVAENIRLGGLSAWLVRPSPYILHDVGNNIGEKVVKLPFLLPLLALVALLFRRDLALPADPGPWALFAAALVLGAAVAFLIDFVIGSLAFWIADVRGLLRVKDLLGAFLAGRFVPLAFFPAAVQGALVVQPFRYTVAFPLELLVGHLSPAEVATGFAWAIGYVLALWALYRLLWRYGLRAYTASGA